MAVEYVHLPSGEGRGRRVGRLPVVRWLQVGAGAAGLGVALTVAPAVAAADADGGSASERATSSAAEKSTRVSTGGLRRSGGSTGDAGKAEVRRSPHALGSLPRSASARTSQLAEAASAVSAAKALAAVDPVANASAGLSGGGDAIPPALSGLKRLQSGRGANNADSITSVRVERPAPASTGDFSEGGIYDYDYGVGVGSSAPASGSVAPAYPASVTAPVTWRSVITEGLSWIGLGNLGNNLPIPSAPVPDLLAWIWTGMRRLHYTLFNTAPTLAPGEQTVDLETGQFVGSLGGTDVDGDVITYVVTSAPAHGRLEIIDDGTYVYTPDDGFASTGGADSFTVRATDDNSANPAHFHLLDDVNAALNRLATLLGLPTNAPPPRTATINVIEPGGILLGRSFGQIRGVHVSLKNRTDQMIAVVAVQEGHRDNGTDGPPTFVSPNAWAFFGSPPAYAQSTELHLRIYTAHQDGQGNWELGELRNIVRNHNGAIDYPVQFVYGDPFRVWFNTQDGVKVGQIANRAYVSDDEFSEGEDRHYDSPSGQRIYGARVDDSEDHINFVVEVHGLSMVPTVDGLNAYYAPLEWPGPGGSDIDNVYTFFPDRVDEGVIDVADRDRYF